MINLDNVSGKMADMETTTPAGQPIVEREKVISKLRSVCRYTYFLP
jgi:hypothetical protein